MPRTGLAILSFVCGLQAVCGCSSRPEAVNRGLAGAARGWNVLLVSVDTLRADRLGAYGYSTRESSPNLDRWMASGVRFERAMAPRSLTWPSLGSALTGLYPSSHGIVSNGYSFPDEVATLPKLLQAAGYQTGAFLANMCKANHQGWDRHSCVKDRRLLGKATAWLEALDPGRPFFLWAHYMGAHDPFRIGGDLADQLDRGYSGPVRPVKSHLDRLMRERIALDQADLRHLNALYDAAVIKTDERIRKLFSAIRSTGRWQQTLVVFVADHGQELYDHHGYLYHSCSVYQAGLHVPLAFAAPGLLESGLTIPQSVEVVDLMPTVLELLAVEEPSPLDGVSLLPYLQGQGTGSAGRPAYSEWPGTGLRTVVAGSWKLIDNPSGHRPHCFEGAPPDFFPLEEVELYHLMDDPGERVNLASRHPEKVAELRELIRTRFAGVRVRSHAQEIPEEVQEELRALGYLAGNN